MYNVEVSCDGGNTYSVLERGISESRAIERKRDIEDHGPGDIDIRIINMDDRA